MTSPYNADFDGDEMNLHLAQVDFFLKHGACWVGDSRSNKLSMYGICFLHVALNFMVTLVNVGKYSIHGTCGNDI